MNKSRIKFSNSSTDFYFSARFSQLKSVVDRKRTVLITDRNVFRFHNEKFSGWNTIVIKAGEKNKNQKTVDSIIRDLIRMQVDRTWAIVGVGGGVVTDIAGYVASIFLRGLPVGFVPTSLLAMVDAAVGGKNGIDVGVYKNMVGTINQPDFILYDESFLTTLPQREWRNGFAEIIKHACIGDAAMFRELQNHELQFYQSNKKSLADLIRRNAKFKIKMVQNDEFEKGSRKLLNFGHTLGHAIENSYKLMHGEAVAIGMQAAANFSTRLLNFGKSEDVKALIKNYGLPVQMKFDAEEVFKVMVSDKKRSGSEMNYVLLEKIGKATVVKIKLTELKKMINQL